MQVVSILKMHNWDAVKYNFLWCVLLQRVTCTVVPGYWQHYSTSFVHSVCFPALFWLFRKFFTEVPAPKVRGDFLEHLLTKFSRRYFSCNPNMNLSQGTVLFIAFRGLTSIFIAYKLADCLLLDHNDTSGFFCWPCDGVPSMTPSI